MKNSAELAAAVANSTALVLPTVDALPKALEKLRQLERLGLLSEEVLLSLVAVAPIDPIGLFRSLQPYIEHWTFQPLNCTVVTVLAKVKGQPVAVMELDLLSDDVKFIARQKGHLVQVAALSSDEMLDVMRRPGITSEQVWAWFQESIAQTVRTGME